MQMNIGRENSPVPEKMRVIIMLPAFNEASDIGTLLERIYEVMLDSGLSYKIIIIDDGSTDTTVDVVSRFAVFMPIRIERHAVNKGLGATLRDGLSLATREAGDRDIIITMDADDTHTPGLILRMVRMIREGYDVVIASRFRDESRVIGVPFHRQVISILASLLFRFFFPTKGVKDFTCGYRAYRASVIKMALSCWGDSFLERDGFECMVDILLKLRKKHLIFGEVPFILRYDHKESATKMKLLVTIKNSLLLILRRKLRK